MQNSIILSRPASAEAYHTNLGRPTVTESSLASQLSAWVLMIPLLCVASDGVLWFRGGAGITMMSATYGSLAASASNATDNAAIGGLLFIFISLLVLPRFNAVRLLFKRDKVFMIFSGWLLLSCLWSQFPQVSIRWAPVMLLNIVFAFYLYLRFKPEQQMRLFLMLGSICLLISITLALLFPRFGLDPSMFQPSWRGMYSQKNLCSMATLFFLPAAFFVPVAGVFSAGLRVVYILFSVLTVIMTHSATGKVTLACLLAFLAVQKILSYFDTRTRVAGFATMAVLLAALAAVGFSSMTDVLILLGKDPTLTGRTEIWHTIMPAVMKHPLLGYGYSGFWRGFEGESANLSLANGWSVTSAHNGILELWLDLGIVGVLIFAYTLVRAARDAFTCFRGGSSPYLNWCTCMILLAVLISADEAEFLVSSTIMRLLFIVGCLGLAEGAARLRQRSAHV